MLINAPSLFSGPPSFLAQTRWPPTWAAVTGVAIVAAAVAASAASYFGCLVADGLSFQTIGRQTPLSSEGIRCLLIALGVQQALFGALAAFAAGFFADSRRAALALRPVSWPTCLLALLVMAPAVALYTLIVWALSPVDLGRDLGEFLPIIRSDAVWPALLAIGVGAPLSEEFLFRGFLLPALSRSRLGFWGAAFVTSAAWTALHLRYSVFGIIEVFLIGLYFSWLLWRTGSLWTAIVCHALYNTGVMLALRFWPWPL